MYENSSFGAGFASIDEADAPALLAYLDGLAQIPAVREAKRAASIALALRPGQRVLDVGCGTGVDLPYLAAQIGPDGTVLGLDPSANALLAAARRVSGSTRVELVRGAVERLPFADGALDACRVDRVLEHVPDPERALRELRRVLRHGGRLVILEMVSYLHGEANDPELASLVADRLSSRGGEAWLPYMLPLLLKRAGFAEVEVRQTEASSSSLREADLLQRLRASLEDAVLDGDLGRARAANWLEQLGAAEQRGAFGLQMHFACTSAVAA